MLKEASQRQRLRKRYIFTVAPWTEKPLSETCAETMLPPKGQGLPWKLAAPATKEATASQLR